MRFWRSTFVSFLVLLTAGCGGGGSNSNVPPASQTVSGVAATGSPISGTVYLKDSSSPAKEISNQINSDGSYSFDVTSFTAPFMLKAVGTANAQNYTLYSLAGAPGIANINPLSHLAVVRANNGADPASLYANLTPAQAQDIKTALAIIIPQLQAMLQQVLSQYGVASTNFVSDKYTANHMGLDLLFDMITIVINNSTLTMSNRVSGAAILTTTLSGNTLSGQVVTANIPTIASQIAGAVYAYPASATVAFGGTASFKAIVIGAANQAITWNVVEAGGGIITSAGVYTAPASAGTYHVKATSVADTTKSTTVLVLVTAAGDTSSTPSFGPFTDAMFSNRVILGDGTKIFTADHKVLFVLDSPISPVGTWAVSSDNVLTITTATGSTAYKFQAYAGTGALTIKNIATISNVTAGTSTDWALQTISYISFPSLYSNFASELAGRTLTVSLATGTPATLTFIYIGGTGNLIVSGVTVPFTYTVNASGVISVVTAAGIITIAAEYPPSAITGGKTAFPVAWTSLDKVTYYGTGIIQ